MPTNYLRRGSKRTPPSAHFPPWDDLTGTTPATLVVAGIPIAVAMHDTQSGRNIINALPLFSNAETWGDCIHFEIPIRGGRDRTARINGEVGGLYYWAEEERVLLIYGPTPISGNGPIRLPRPCNLIGHATQDLEPLRKVHPGQKVSLQANRG